MIITEGLSAIAITDYIFGEEDCFSDDELSNGFVEEENRISFSDWILEKKKAKKKIYSRKKLQNICIICYDDIPSTELVTLKDCEHPFCKSCISEYCNFKSGDLGCCYHKVVLVTPEKKGIFNVDILNTYGVRCPSLNCQHVMLPEEFSLFTNPTSVERFQRFTVLHAEGLERIAQQQRQQQLLDAQAVKTFGCPRCESKLVIKIRRGRLKCTKCFAPFCAACGKDHRRSLTCEEFERLIEEGKKKCLDKSVVDCPNCFIPTTRYDGCNYMICRCSQNFCNLCGCPLDQSKHFTHFKGKPFDGECLGKKDSSALIGTKK